MKGMDLLISELATICVELLLCTTASLVPQKDGCTNAVALLTHATATAAAAAAAFISLCQ
jgi:ADP-ribosylglycohydrolase